MGRTVVRNATTIDLEHEQIRVGDVALGNGADPTHVLDGTGLFAIPGLIDMHVHVCHGGREAVERSLDSLRASLAAGITAVRDLGGNAQAAFATRTRIREDPDSYPELFLAGPALTAPGGHGARSGLAVEVDDLDAAQAVVADLASRGTDVVKVIVGSGSAPVGFPELPESIVAATILTAHLHGLPVAAHANFRLEHVVRAIDAGCDTLEHGTLMCEVDADRLSQFALRGGAYCPTLSVLEQLRCSTEQDEISVRLRAAAERYWPQALESVQVARDTGIVVLAGTDAGARDAALGALAHEVRLLHQAGLSRAGALRGATTAAQRYLTFPPGAAAPRADLVLLSGNPLDDLDALDEPIAVIRGGTLSHLRDTSRADRKAKASS